MQVKTLFFLLLLTATPLLLMAQQSTIDQISIETCNCMTQKDVSGMEQSQFEQELGMCMLTAATPLMTQLQEEENIDLNDPNAFQKIGEKVGAKIATSCPDLFSKMMEFYGAEVQTESEVRQLLVMEGTFAGLKTGEVARIQLSGGSGGTADFLWLEAFEGSEALEADPAALKGKAIKVFFTEKSIYNPSRKAYEAQKVVQRIEIK
ncbi:MAG TPA: hypothetical protein VJ953_08750 [Saprospiraceae bacterium]|nr:hypothetical protein [Saprospiraceae bacterium]